MVEGGLSSPEFHNSKDRNYKYKGPLTTEQKVKCTDWTHSLNIFRLRTRQFPAVLFPPPPETCWSARGCAPASRRALLLSSFIAVEVIKVFPILPSTRQRLIFLAKLYRTAYPQW